MERTINTIQDEIIEAVEASGNLNALEVLTENEQSTLTALSSTSKVSVWRLYIWVVSFGIWIHEQLMDVLKQDIEARITQTRPFTKHWYEATSLDYQHGYSLPETGSYALPNNTTEAQTIAASKLIKKAAVVQTVFSGVGALRVKVATLNNNELVAVPDAVLQGFQEYIELKGAAGVYVITTTSEADKLKIAYDIHFNALILDNEGKRLDGTNDTPVQDALKSYLKSVDFNGILSLDRLDQVLQKVEGVTDVFIQEAASKYANFEYTTTGIDTAGEITKFRQPDSGYFKLDEAESYFTFIAS
ncbi:MAG: hypothetical protein ACPG6B_01440 [Oceanihabitans sp.]